MTRQRSGAEPELAINYEPEPTLARFHICDDFFRSLMGPFGSGKSVGCVMEMFMRACAQRPNENNVRKTRWAAVRNTYGELKTTTIKTFQDWFPDEICPILWDQPITAHMVYPLEDGTVVDWETLFFACDRPQDVGKFKSLELTGVWLNEMMEIPKAALDILTSRVGRYPSKRDGGYSWRGVIGDTNAPDDDHWFYKMAEVQKPQIKLRSGKVLRYSFFKQPPALLESKLRDGEYVPNPEAENVKNLEGGYEYYYQLIPGKTKEWIKRYVYGQYAAVIEGKPVYPEYREERHLALVDIPPMRGIPIYLGWDYGLTPACVIVQLSPRGRLMVLDELCSEDMGIRQFARDVVKPHLANNYANMEMISVGDPAGAERSGIDTELTCQKELANAGIPTQSAYTNEFTARRESVVGFLTSDRDGESAFQLSPKCDRLRKGFNGRYRYSRLQVVGQERYTDKPVKDEYSHPQDALQCICLTLEAPRVIRSTKHRTVRVANSGGWT